ncbi:MAG: sugar phosphate isomerase/epimerase [Xanthobacteraceae bacterium]|jgi:sugar phosphate isomerase/epimerase|nr:sugar phosphate isomerase/epimerase [Xanthobacteraceae bacterium]
MIDTWHFPRGKLDLDLLRAIPSRFLRAAQVSDATRVIRGATLFEDTVRYRMFPGEGELPLVKILEILVEKGLQEVGPEVFSDEADRLPPEETGRRCGAGLRRVLEAAGAALAANDLRPRF